MQADNPLLNMPNVAILPHIGSATIEALPEWRGRPENIMGFYNNKNMPTCLNPEVLHWSTALQAPNIFAMFAP